MVVLDIEEMGPVINRLRRAQGQIGGGTTARTS